MSEKRMVLQNPAKRNHRIYITLCVELNYGDGEANECYSSENISEVVQDRFRCEVCDGFHLNTDVCGMDDMWLDDIEDCPLGEEGEK